MSAFRKPLRSMENQVKPSRDTNDHVSDAAPYLRRQAPAITLKLSTIPEPPSIEKQLEAARVAIRALLQHGRRADIVLQAEHVLAMRVRP